MWKLRHELPSDLRFRILKNWQILRKSLKSYYQRLSKSLKNAYEEVYFLENLQASSLPL